MEINKPQQAALIELARYASAVLSNRNVYHADIRIFREQVAKIDNELEQDQS